MDQKIIDLFDKYTHGQLDRRDFLERLTKLAGSTAAAMAVLPLLQNNWAQAAIIDEKDARLSTERVTFDSPKGKINGYLARPKSRGKRPTILVIHENRGLNPHLEAVATLVAAVSFLKKHPESTGKVGAVGFCFGGLMVNRLAASSKELDAGVAYYGRQVPAAQVPNITAPLMLHYAEKDDGVNAGIADYEAALKANNKKYVLHMYPGTQHAFNNDLGAARYNKAAADLAWGRTLAFFKETLGVPPSAA
jgi:carboxymethylenebutenolidase